MKTIISSLKRTKHGWFSVSIAFITCLFFLSFPSCQKDESDQEYLIKSTGKYKKPKFKHDVSDADGNVYATVKIGNQIWMAENLRTTKYNDGTEIPPIESNYAWSELTTPAYCCYNNEISNKEVYGALYNWYAVNTGKLCPVGFHVPSDAEWHELALFLDPNAILKSPNDVGYDGITSLFAGSKLKETGNEHWLEANTDATNETGFTALGGGLNAIIDGNASFIWLGYLSYWWSSTETEFDLKPYIWGRGMTYNNSKLIRPLTLKNQGLYIRCISD
jgi:uncharacterized protein (TIGR02145 family)